LQIGIEKSVVNNIFLYSKYEWIKYGHTMEIRNKNSLVEHTNQQNLLIGVKYVF
jgi:opacity protein-like surface antigen